MQGACQALPEERQRGCLLPAGADPMDGFPGMQTNQNALRGWKTGMAFASSDGVCVRRIGKLSERLTRSRRCKGRAVFYDVTGKLGRQNAAMTPKSEDLPCV